MIQTFGDAATRYGAMLPTGLPAIITDPWNAVYALQAAADRRCKGEPFFVSVLLEDRQAYLAQQFAPSLMEPNPALDACRGALDRLALEQISVNGTSIAKFRPYDEKLIKTLADFVLCGDALLVRSHAERRRIQSELGRVRPHVAIYPGEDARVPAFSRTKPKYFVIWAPDLDARVVSHIAFALQERHTPVFIISKGGLPVGSRAKVADLKSARELLSAAAVVIDASISDPSSAIALAKRGVPLVVAATSGAAEFIDGVQTYRPSNWQSILAAVSKAQAAERPSLRPMPGNDIERILSAVTPEIPKKPPLVSILLPTYNRPGRLRQQLERLSAQTYPSIEIVVSNDGGEPVDHIVRDFPKARLHECAENGGSSRATNAAFAVSRGDYICIIPDDDVFYPTHIARMVNAAQKSKAKILHSNILFRLLEKCPSGEYRTFGFLSHYDGSLDPSQTLGHVTISVQGMFFDRSVFQDNILYDDDIPLVADAEMVMRFSRLYDFVHVDDVGGEAHYRSDASQQSAANGARLVEETKMVFARYPTTGRQWLEEMRRGSIASLTAMLVDGGGLHPAMRIPVNTK